MQVSCHNWLLTEIWNLDVWTQFQLYVEYFQQLLLQVEYFPLRKYAISLRFMIMKLKYDRIIISRIMQLRTINSLHHANGAYMIKSRRWRDIFILTVSSCAHICITVKWYIYTLGCSQVAANRLRTACHMLFLVLLDIYIFSQSNSTCNTMESSTTYHQWNYLKVTSARKHPSIYKRRIQTGRAFLFSVCLEDSWVLASSLGLSCCPSNCELLLEIETVEQSPLPLEWVQ